MVALAGGCSTGYSIPGKRKREREGGREGEGGTSVCEVELGIFINIPLGTVNFYYTCL